MRAHDRTPDRPLDPPPARRHRGRVRARALGRVRRIHHAGGCDPRPVGEPGHRLHRVAGPWPARGGGPGQLSALHPPPGDSRRAGGAVVERFRLLDDPRDLRRRRRLPRRPAGACSSGWRRPGNILPAAWYPSPPPDAVATGQIFWYTVEGGGLDLGRLRAFQDWYVGPQLSAVPGVAEVASVGGYPDRVPGERRPAASCAREA